MRSVLDKMLSRTKDDDDLGHDDSSDDDSDDDMLADAVGSVASDEERDDELQVLACAGPAAAPSAAPPVQVDYNNPFVLSLVLIELVPPFVPPSVPAFGFSPTCFPDLYAPSITPHTAVGPGFGSFAMPAFPAAFFGKVLFQGVGFSSGTFEFSTPAVLDVF